VNARQFLLDLNGKLIVDLFAGGGGMSLAFEKAFGRSPDIAVNHDDDALSMHRMNHPQTRHFVADVFEVCPKAVTQGRPVGWLHGSPDCTHHSQAAGGQPRSKKIRGLGWVLPRWAGQVRPEVISMENVKQMLKWGPLVAKRDPETGRVVTLDKVKCPTTGKMIHRVADKGERVPVQDQYLVPDKKREGQTWRRFVATFEALGYRWDYRVRCAADAGGHTTRTRLFFIARRDGQPIVFPEARYFKEPKKGQKRWKAAAECIDFSIPCRSIFGRERPLADATLKRIAMGIRKFVLENPKPFIVNMAHGGKIEDITRPISTIATENGGCRALVTPFVAPLTHQGADRGRSVESPLPTITTAHRGEQALISPVLIQAGHGEGKPDAPRWSYGHNDIQGPLGTVVASGGGHAVAAAMLVQTGYGERDGQAPRVLDIEQPLGTVVGTGKHAVAAAYLMQANGGFNTTPGHAADEPFSTVTNSGSQQQLVTAFLSRQFGASIGHAADDPMGTVMAGGGGKTSIVECTLSPSEESGALQVAAFLMRYYGQGGQWSDIADPMTTITTKDRMALVTVSIAGTPYVIVDIGLRMLEPRELYRAQDFPDSYIIDRGHDGRKFPKSTQVRMVGNSVNPQDAADFLEANAPWLSVRCAA
jgi:DNA (cytosine-5)-methyltransferase 1